MPPYIPKDTVALLAKIPAIPAQRADLTELYRRFKTLLDRSPRTKLLSILKYAAFVVLLINFGSLPFVWHSESSLTAVFPLRSSTGPCRPYREYLAQQMFYFLLARVFGPIFSAKVNFWILHFKLILASKKERTRALVAWVGNRSPVGANPFEVTTVYRRWASASFKSMKIHFCADSCDWMLSSGIDDIDMLMHLSNSSYAKARLFFCYPA